MSAQRLSLFLGLGMGSSDGIEVGKGAKPVSDETPPDGWPSKPAELGAAVRRAREHARLPRRVQTFLVLSFGRIGERQS